jgi:uncharacterized membrane protein YeaQ/YmgE (transglycosylase-associated protein family)
LSPGRTGETAFVQVIGLILIGIVIGVLARLLLPGRQHIGFLMTILLGIGGAVIGGVVASAIGEGDIWELNFVGTIVGIIAAVLLIALAETVGVGSDRAPAKRQPPPRRRAR